MSYFRNRSRQYFLAEASSAADDIWELGCSTSDEANRLCGMRHVVPLLLVMAPVQALFVALMLAVVPFFFLMPGCLSRTNPLLLVQFLQARYSTKRNRLYIKE